MRQRPPLNKVNGNRPRCAGVLMFGGRYTVYKNGVVIREAIQAIGMSGCKRDLPPIFLRQIMLKKYLHVNINIAGGRCLGLRPVHRLVCEAFYGKPPMPRMDVNHKDGNKLNNWWRNLEWATRQQNQQHAADTGLSPVGEESDKAKISANDARVIISMRGKVTQAALARRFGITVSQIGRIQRREQWKQLKIA